MKELEEYLTLYAAPGTNFSRKEALDILYQNIEAWMQPLLAKKLATITRIPTQLDTLGFGVEHVDSLYLDFPILNSPRRFTFTPATDALQVWVTLGAYVYDQKLVYDRDRKVWGTVGTTPLTANRLAEILRGQLTWGFR